MHCPKCMQDFEIPYPDALPGFEQRTNRRQTFHLDLSLPIYLAKKIIQVTLSVMQVLLPFSMTCIPDEFERKDIICIIQDQFFFPPAIHVLTNIWLLGFRLGLL